MRKIRHCGLGIHGSYARYGLSNERAKTLLKECMAGKHADLVRAAAQQAGPGIAEWLLLSIMEGKTLHDMQIKWELGEADKMPCCRNSFYAYRKLTLAILDNMLAGKGTVQDGQL